MDKLDEFTIGYITCALWLFDENPGPGEWDRFDEFFPRLAPETVAAMKADCAAFQAANTGMLERAYDMGFAQGHYNAARAGHDFWLTRNHHGAGYWDRGLGEVGDELTKAAHIYGSRDLYAGDDGKIYQM